MTHFQIIDAIKQNCLLDAAVRYVDNYDKLSLVIALACDIVADTKQIRQLNLYLLAIQ